MSDANPSSSDTNPSTMPLLLAVLLALGGCTTMPAANDEAGHIATRCDDGDRMSGDGCSASIAVSATCGNGIVDTAEGEECDEGGVDTATCNWSCTVPVCGDGHVNLAAGEDCETGGESAFCDADCTFAWCGDGTVNAAAGEECDDGNAYDGDACLSTCELASVPLGRLVAGDIHTCALLETGAVRCWGHGQYGRLGYGNTSNIGDDEAPVTAGDVDVGGVVTQLAAAYAHTCALLETGAVRCWGRGNAGQLGYGNTDHIGDDEAPALSGDVDVGGVVAQLVTGGHRTCALLETGAVRCWGSGTAGGLGYSSTSNIGDNEVPATAGDVDVGGVVAQLASGFYHTCALLETGAVRCWGEGAFGELGYSNTNDVGDDEVPAAAGDVDVGCRVVQLSAGMWHTCALLETGAVRCWGLGASGQLGYSNTNDVGDDEVPDAAGDVDVGGRVVQLSAGAWHTCALLETGAVRCWGQGMYGQLGYGNTSSIGDNETPATAGDVNLGAVAVQLAAGKYHTCALLETDEVRCWGGGWTGQLGYGNTSNIGDNETPASAGDVPYQ